MLPTFKIKCVEYTLNDRRICPSDTPNAWFTGNNPGDSQLFWFVFAYFWLFCHLCALIKESPPDQHVSLEGRQSSLNESNWSGQKHVVSGR